MKHFLYITIYILTTIGYGWTQNKSDTTVTKMPIVVSPLQRIDSIKGIDEIIPTLDFKNADIRDVLRGIGIQYGINIFLESSVKGTISLYLTNIKVRDALVFIIERNNFHYSVTNSVIRVYKKIEEPPPPKPKPPVVFHKKGNTLDIDIREIPVRAVTRLFIDSAGVNVVLDGSGSKTITARLTNIPIKKAISIVFTTHGYEVTEKDSVFYVAALQWEQENNQKGRQNNTNGQQRRPRRMSIEVTKDKKITLEVKEAPIDQLVRDIAFESGINIILYEKLSGAITAKCDSTRLDDLLSFILQNTKYAFWKDKGIYFIGSREMSQQKTTEVIPLSHIRAEEGLVSKYLPAKILRDAVVKYDSEHNSVIVTGSFEVVSQTKDFIEKIDKPIPQVLIEALVVEFNLSKIRSYGVSMFTGSDSSSNWNNEQFLPNVDLKPGRLRITRLLNKLFDFVGSNKVVKLPETFKASIRALEAADVVKVHSTPQIATINGNPANITIGETRYYKLSKETKNATNNTNGNVIGVDERFVEKKFNTTLDVTPWVMSDGYVMVDIRPEFNIPRSGGDSDRPPTIDTRVIKSMVRLRNGQTIVLGGQRQTENIVNSKGVPILSSIPILGWLFSSKTITKNETQMMIFLTPHVYYGDEGVVSPDDYFGDELNEILDEHDPKMAEERKEYKKEERKKRREKRREKRRKRLEEIFGNNSSTTEQHDSTTTEEPFIVKDPHDGH